MSTRSDSDSQTRSFAEWLTLAISITVVLGMVAAVSWLYLRGSEEPPQITVNVLEDSIREAGGNFYVPIEIVNDGDRTASAARVEGTLTLPDGTEEQGDVTIDYLSGGERAPAEVIFSSDPRSGELEVRAISFVDP